MNTEIISESDQIKLLQIQVATLAKTNKLLQEQLAWFKKQLFGQKSERFVPDNANILYLPGFSAESFKEAVPEEKTHVPAHEKRKAKSTLVNTISFPEDLPVEQHIIDLPDEEKYDPSGNPLICIGEDVSRKLAKKPASYFIKEFIRKKYAVAGASEEGIRNGNLPDSIITRCAVDESVLADVLVKKFCDHLPLYRQVEMMLRDNIKISKQTLDFFRN